ncbi:MAG: DUF3995 domain-containing protein [Acidobacteriota bacterium]
MTPPLVGPAVVLVLAALSLLHVFWGFGGRIGWLAVVPEVDRKPLFVPTQAQSFAVAAGLALAALTVAGAAGMISLPVPKGFLRGTTYVIAAVFLLRAIGEFRHVGFFKRNRGTRFARLDTFLFSPLCMALAAGAWLVAKIAV